jgi:predicted secreted protein
MKRLLAFVVCLVISVVLCQTAHAVLCAKCRGKVHDNQFGTCRECRGNTRSTATQLCPACSAELVRCELCYKRLTDVDRAQAQAGKPQTIDLRKSGEYKFEKWMYRYEISGIGTSRAQVRGRLAYSGKEVQAGQINDYYKTPWGYLYWAGNTGSATTKRGWLTSPLQGAGRHGALLTPQASGGSLVQLTEADNRREISLPAGTRILVKMRGNPDTGKRWSISKISSGSVESLARRPTFVADPGRSGTTSRGGSFSFQFKAAKPGKAIVELSYGKTASAYSRPERTFTVTIDVK